MKQETKKLILQLNDQNTYMKNLIESLLQEDVIEETKYFTGSELSKIFNITRGTISHWITEGKINNFEQNHKNCKIRIPFKEVDRLVKGTKYENIWINYNS